MVEYNTEILSLYTARQINNLSDVVKRIVWKFTAKDGSYAVDLFKESFFDNADQTNFVQFNELNPDIIIPWLETSVDFESLKVEANLKLEELKNPSTLTEKTKPWEYHNFYFLEDKYVLFHQGNLLWGPIHWHSDIFNSYLEQVNLPPSLPGDIHARQRKIVPIFEPLVINEATNTKIYKCILINDEPEGNYFTKNDNIQWNMNVWPIEGTYIQIDRSLEDVKENLLYDLLVKRQEKDFISLNVVVNNENLKIFTDYNTRSLIIQRLYSVDNDTDEFFWNFLDNQWRLINKLDLKRLLKEIDAHHLSVDSWHLSKTSLINQATSVDELRTLDLT